MVIVFGSHGQAFSYSDTTGTIWTTGCPGTKQVVTPHGKGTKQVVTPRGAKVRLRVQSFWRIRMMQPEALPHACHGVR